MDDEVIVELTYETYSILRDEVINSAAPNIKPLLNKTFEFFRKLKPRDVIKSLLNGKTLRYYYEKSSLNPYTIGLRMARGLVKAKPIYLDSLKKSLTPKFILLLLKYENPEVYKTLESIATKEKMEEWIKKNIDDLIEILTPKKE